MQMERAYLRSLFCHIEVGENLIKIGKLTADLAKLISNFNKSGKLVPNFDRKCLTIENQEAN